MRAGTSWDAIIVGGGTGGLVCGTYLAREGLKTLLIEREPDCGGYVRPLKYRGYSVDRTYLMSHVTILEVLRDLGIDVPVRTFPPFRTYAGGKLQPNAGLTDREHIAVLTGAPATTAEKLVQVYATIGALTEEAIPALRPVPIAEWVGGDTWSEIGDSLVQDLVRRAVLLTPNHVAWLSVGELARFFSGGGPSESGRSAERIYPAHPTIGGMAAIPQSLVQAYLRYGGTLITSAPVTEILVNDRHATGVVFLEQSGFTEEARAPIVVCDVPIWDISSIIDAANVSLDMVRNAKQLANLTSEQVTVACGLRRLPRKRSDGEVEDFTGMTRLMFDEGRRLGGSFFIPSMVSPAIAPGDQHLLIALRIIPYGMTRRWSNVQAIAAELLGAVRELYGDFDEVCEWQKVIVIQGKAFPNHALTTIPRPAVRSDDVEGLFFVGDTPETDQGRPWCLDLAAYNGRKAARMITNKV